MRGFYYELQSILSATVCYWITAYQTLFLIFIAGWFCIFGFFVIMLGSKQNINFFLLICILSF